MKMKLLTAIAASIILMTVAATASRASVVYTYTSSLSNPLYGLSPDAGIIPDYISISFISYSALAANSTYNISVNPSGTVIPFWEATDSRFLITLNGLDAPLSLVPAPGLIEGGALNACGLTCFGGAIQTDAFGNIVRWNLVADGAAGDPYLTFIIYNTAGLGSIDGLGSTQNGVEMLELNALNGITGAWTESVLPSSIPLPATLPLFASGLGALGLLRWRRKRKAHAGRLI